MNYSQISHILLFCLFIGNFTSGISQDKLIGVSSEGGGHGLGVLYSTSPDGSTSLVEEASFRTDFPGGNSQFGKLLELPDGKLYGLSRGGGTKGEGTIFSYSPSNNVYTILAEFDKETTGYDPQGSLTFYSESKLYGMTNRGGQFDYGSLFEFDIITNTITKLVDFNDINGRYPSGDLTLASNGKFYGLTPQGGINHAGVIFMFDPVTNILEKQHDMLYAMFPFGSLIEMPTGKLMGMSSYGGTTLKGTIFEFDPATKDVTIRLNFQELSSGSRPYGDLLLANNGKLYGLTSLGGEFGSGVLFEYDPENETVRKLSDFNFDVTGASPFGSLIQGSNGKLYGLTSEFGEAGGGTLFSYDLQTDEITHLVAFDKNDKIKTGFNPLSTLLQTTSGSVYGTTYQGGAGSNGVLFKYDVDLNQLQVKVEFNKTITGSWIKGPLVQGYNMKVYGMSYQGGLYGKGVLYEFDLTLQKLKKLIDFNGLNGEFPSEGLMLHKQSGKLYGITSSGGVNGVGVLFEYAPGNGTYTKIVDFDETLGIAPTGALIQTPEGRIFGVTQQGGTGFGGVLFEYDDQSKSVIKLKDFNSIGADFPIGFLIIHNNKIYGASRKDSGVLFEYDYNTNELIKLADFNADTGRYPSGSIGVGTNGKFYGSTTGGGLFNFGTIYEFDPATNELLKKYDFGEDINEGYYNVAGLTLSKNNKFYGVTKAGGLHDKGVLFEYNYVDDTYEALQNFNNINGAVPLSNLILTSSELVTSLSDDNATSLSIFPNPTDNQLYFNFSSEEPITKMVYFVNTTGQQIPLPLVKLSGSNEYICGTGELTPGLYVVMIPNSINTKRIVVQH